MVNIGSLRTSLGITFPTATKLVSEFQRHGLLEELTGFRRNRVFRYTPYLALFADDRIADAPAQVRSTESR